jgi:hypothetical protein
MIDHFAESDLGDMQRPCTGQLRALVNELVSCNVHRQRA